MRTLFAGAGLALAAGMLMGTAMKPDLGAFDRPAGPQMITQAGDAGPTGPFDDRLAYASYSGALPDYVLGTDWKRLVEAPAAVYAREPEVDYGVPPASHEDPRAEVGTYTPAVYRAPRAEERISFPSLDGGAAYEDVSRAEKTPIIRSVDVDDEAPPEATGDTTPAKARWGQAEAPDR